MRTIVVILMVIGYLFVSGQKSAEGQTGKNSGYTFGQIFTDFHYSLDGEYSPEAAFNFNQGIIGYAHQLSDKLKGTIMYDVTRTTHILDISDTTGFPLNYSYFEGSKYTAYLKMAEIKYAVNNWLTLRAGQLLSTQYLTFQDRFWGFRFVDVTFQERFRLGMPADFGAQIDLKYKDKLLNQVSVVNGEGPFRHQDVSGKFLYANNIQYYPTSKITLKLYTDYGPATDTGENQKPSSVIAGFAGYKTENFRVGGEYVHIINFGHLDGQNSSGFSIFTGIKVHEKFTCLARYDRLVLDVADMDEEFNYYITGIQYEPVKKLMTALTFRRLEPESTNFIFASFGLKF